MQNIYDLVIIGGGPAGAGAGVYAGRKMLKTALITESFGGQSTVSTDIHNWIGTVSISGPELALSLEKHIKAYSGNLLEVIESDRVIKIIRLSDFENEPLFQVETQGGRILQTKTILIATGSSRRKLEVPGAKDFEHKGITYCASCDGPIFAGKDTVVIGGGNAGFETAAQLLAYAKSVTLLHRGSEYKADPITVKKVLAHPNMKGILNVETTEVGGDKFVNYLKYRDINTKEEFKLDVQGVFVEIGALPNTDIVKDMVELDQYGRIVIDHKSQRTSQLGIWSAGDCTDILYHQNNIATGDAVKALEDIYFYLRA